MQPPPPTEPEPAATAPARRAARRERAATLRSVALRRLVAGLLLAWSAALLAREATAAFSGWRDRRDHSGHPFVWRFDTPATNWLARCLASADAAAEPGSRIVLLAPKEDFFRGRWAAYLLPAHDLIADHRELANADLVVALNGATLPGASVVGGGKRCRLLRPAVSTERM
jgi:hypothetical protein